MASPYSDNRYVRIPNNAIDCNNFDKSLICTNEQAYNQWLPYSKLPKWESPHKFDLNSPNFTIRLIYNALAPLGRSLGDVERGFEEEINSYGTRISNIHIKDRVLGGGPIILGKGNADLYKIKSFIKESNYDGLVIFQAYRDDKGIEIFKEQYQYFLSI